MSDEPVDVECVIVDRDTGVKSPPYRAKVDLHDSEALQKLLEDLARGWQGLPGYPSWRPCYEMRVKQVRRPWDDEVYVAGLPYDD